MTITYGTSAPAAKTPLQALCGKLLETHNPIFVSNRGPIEFSMSAYGLSASRGSGGVVTALTAASNQFEDVTWISLAMTDDDRIAAEALGKNIWFPDLSKANLRLVVTPKSVYHRHYNVFCNPLLWFLQHSMWDFCRTPSIDFSVYEAWERGYVAVNKSIAKAVLEEAALQDKPPLVMLQDYHLYLAAAYIRESRPDALIQHFTHIPWPSPQYWQILPPEMRTGIIAGMCANDVVGFQTERDAKNFLYSCSELLPDSLVDYDCSTVCLKDHVTYVRTYPISVDAEQLKQMAVSSEVLEYKHKIRPSLGEYTIVRVDRLDPSKNILRGFQAFELLLKRRPELVGKVKFLAFLVPSRNGIKEYKKYAKDVFKLIDRINQKFGVEGVKPIEVFYENNYAQAIAALKLYDVLLVNSVADGMNLVAKEGSIVNERDGVLVLSETTGAYQQLGHNAISVTPTDIEGTSEALYRGLTMGPVERASRAGALRSCVEQNEIADWICKQLTDLTSVV